jgi:hypothetical protein
MPLLTMKIYDDNITAKNVILPCDVIMNVLN